MRFLSLKIRGFKSFPDRTMFRFHDGITAIVGPNGCGKSNIVDALKWVMGEQSAKSLRGRKMEDIIFSGTEKRRGMGMAEIVLTIANDSGLVPLPQSEIAVTRRLNRHGDSEYLINEARCRLKDITGIFQDTGISARSYSLMEQGNVDAFLRSKPTERRAFIEETAGIVKYKSQKEEAQRKLKAARQNLVRVEDILSEVEDQMRLLAQQAKRAKRYKNLLNNLREKNRLLLVSEWVSLDAESGELKAKTLTLEDCEAEFMAGVTGNEGKLVRLRECVSETEESLRRARSDCHEIEIAVRDALNRGERAKERIYLSESRIRELVAERKELEHQTEFARNDIRDCARRIAEMKSSCAELSSKRQDTENSLKEALDRQEKAEAKLQARRRAILKTASDLSGVRATLERIDTEESKSGERIAGLVGEADLLGAEIRKIEDELKRLAGLMEDTEDEEERFGDEFDESERVRTDARKRIRSLAGQISEIEGKTDRMRHRLEAIDDMIATREGLSGAVKTVLNSKELAPVIVGALVDLVRVRTGFETAFAAASGPFLQAIVVRDATSAGRILRWVQEKNLGRVAVWVRSWEEKETALDVVPGGNAIRLRDVVAPAKGCDFSLDSLLRGYWIVDRIEEGARRAAGQTWVTRSGQALRPGGIIEGGKAASEAVAHLKRRAESEKLALELSEVSETLTPVREAHRRRVTELSDLDKRREILEKELKRLDRSRSRISNELSFLERERAGKKRALDGVRYDKDRLEREITHRREEKKANILRLADLEKEAMKVESEEKEIESEALRAKEAVARLNRALSDIRIREAQLNQSLAHLKADEQRKQRFLQDVSNRMESSLKRRENEEQSRCNAEIELKKAEEATSLGNRNHEKVVLRANELERELDRAKDEMRLSEKELEAHRQKLAEVRTELARLEGERSRILERANAIRDQYLAEIGEQMDFDESEIPDDPDRESLKEEIDSLRRRLDNFGDVNLAAIADYQRVEERYNLLNAQREDILGGVEKLDNLMNRISETTRARFTETFEKVNANFGLLFHDIFGGGRAYLELTDNADPDLRGIEIYASPPGKRLKHIGLMSGGEKALTVLTLLFAIFHVKPSPFCIFDEVDAALDEKNTGKFAKMLDDFARAVQTIIITHNPVTMEHADVLYGVTMEEKGVSKVIPAMLKEERPLFSAEAAKTA